MTPRERILQAAERKWSDYGTLNESTNRAALAAAAEALRIARHQIRDRLLSNTVAAPRYPDQRSWCEVAADQVDAQIDALLVEIEGRPHVEEKKELSGGHESHGGRGDLGSS